MIDRLLTALADALCGDRAPIDLDAANLAHRVSMADLAPDVAAFIPAREDTARA